MEISAEIDHSLVAFKAAQILENLAHLILYRGNSFFNDYDYCYWLRLYCDLDFFVKTMISCNFH